MHPSPSTPKLSLRKYLHGPLVEGLQTRRRRRLVAATHIAAIVALPVVGMLTNEDWAVMAMLLPYIASAALLSAASRWITEPAGRLDERQLHLRNAAFKRWYPLGVAIAFFGAWGSPAPTMVRCNSEC